MTPVVHQILEGVIIVKKGYISGSSLALYLLWLLVFHVGKNGELLPLAVKSTLNASGLFFI